MKKVFKMQDLECAHCAGKMEDAINKLDGVNKATINFMSMKLTLDADSEKFDSILDEAQKICSKIEKDCVILR